MLIANTLSIAKIIYIIPGYIPPDYVYTPDSVIVENPDGELVTH